MQDVHTSPYIYFYIYFHHTFTEPYTICERNWVILLTVKIHLYHCYIRINYDTKLLSITKLIAKVICRAVDPEDTCLPLARKLYRQEKEWNCFQRSLC